MKKGYFSYIKLYYNVRINSTDWKSRLKRCIKMHWETKNKL